jgi:hypothetical protein
MILLVRGLILFAPVTIFVHTIKDRTPMQYACIENDSPGTVLIFYIRKRFFNLNDFTGMECFCLHQFIFACIWNDFAIIRDDFALHW